MDGQNDHRAVKAEESRNQHHKAPTLDINLVCDSFVHCIENRNAIDLTLYIEAYSELIKFFNMFGTLFTFVTKDVTSKLSILQGYLNDKVDGYHYKTIQTMIEFEKRNNLLRDPKRPSGSRTLLRLHRALEFIALFLHEVVKISDEVSTVNCARSAYGKTLAKYHPWLIRKSVQIATIALPYRRHLIEQVYGGGYNGSTVDANQHITNLANIADQVFNVTQKLYEENHLLDLP